MTSLIANINEEYFGKDKRKTYIKDDYSAVLYDVVQRDVLLYVLSECSKARHFEKKIKNKNGSETICRGDYDPDNAGFLDSIFQTYEKGLMVDVRQLLVDSEAGSGGKFIKDILTLTVDDFVDYYKNSKTDKVLIPRLIINKLIANQASDDRLKGSDLIDSNRREIESAVIALTERAAQFRSRGYFNDIVKDYQSLKLHKDRQPEKYDVQEEIEEFGFLTARKSTRNDKAKVKISKIGECLNEFAEVIALYQNLVNSNTSFFNSSLPLDTYIQRTFALFNKDIPDDIQKKAAEDIVKYLDASLHIVGWRHAGIRKT